MSVDYYVLVGGVIIDSDLGNNQIVFNEGGGDLTATLADGTYYPTGSGGTDDLLTEIHDQMEAVGGTYSFSAVYDVDFGDTKPARITFTKSAGSFEFEWANANTTFDQRLIGWEAIDTGSAGAHTSTESALAVWVPNERPTHADPVFVGFGETVRSKARQPYTVDRGGQSVDYRIGWDLIDPIRVWADSTILYRSFQEWRAHYRKGHPFQLHKQTVDSNGEFAALSSSTLVGTFTLDPSSAHGSLEPRRHSPGLELFGIELDLWEYN